MFDNVSFEQWLDENAKKAMQKVTSNEALKSEEIIVLVLKAQTNHITHLEQDLRGEILKLRKDMNNRFEQVDERFEQVDKRFESVQAQINSFMRWSLTAMISCSGVTIAAVVAINQFFAS